jgi:hypothetical protein
MSCGGFGEALRAAVVVKCGVAGHDALPMHLADDAR